MNYLFRAVRFISYLFKGKTKYFIHSPFVFEFINEVLNDKRNFYCYDEIENLRHQIKQSDETIEAQDFGAGSSKVKGEKRKVKEIVSSSAKPAKYAQLLFRTAAFYKCKNILELGTSLGLTTLYLSSTEENSKVVTLEGSKAVAQIAEKNFNKLSKKNVELIKGPFESTLATALSKFSQLDFIFFDGNHRKEPTLNYFHQCLAKVHDDSIFVFDDINWSKEMAEAWEQIKADESVTLTIDVFQLGIVFFKKAKTKEHFTLLF